MGKLRNGFERFCYRNYNKGIPNLMLYISVGSAIVYLISMFAGTGILYNWLCFDRALILKGQVWRLFTYVITYDAGNILFTAVSLLCYFSLGRAMENAWGTCKFNLFYLTGVVLMDIFALLLGGNANVYYLNLSLFLGYATMYPDSRFLLLYIIPVKAWIFALLDLVLTIIDVVSYTAMGLFPFSLFPLVAIANYFLFFGSDVLNLIPMSWRANAARLFRKRPKTQKQSESPKTIPFPTAGSYEATTRRVRPDYRHKCTVCGRTDVSNPELEFRYCSRCKGYYCYCENHISAHTHIEQ